MVLEPFRSRRGFDASGNRLINLADPQVVAATRKRNPTDGVNVETLRELSGFRIVDDEAARLALENSDGDLKAGDVVIDADMLLAWVFTPPNIWEPFGRGGVTFVGRQAGLPQTADDGALYIIKQDFGGQELNRLVVWDESIPARVTMTPAGITRSERYTTPTLGIPTIAEIQLAGMPSPSNAVADAVMRISTTAGPPGGHVFQYQIQPGDTLNDIAAGLAAAYGQSGTHDPATIARAVGDKLVITGSPGSAALAARTVTGATYSGQAQNDLGLWQFLLSGSVSPGDYVLNTAGADLTAPDGATVPPDTAVIIETAQPLLYHVADAPTPIQPPALATQRGSGTPTLVATQAELVQWLTGHQGTTGIGDYALNVAATGLTGGGWQLPLRTALVQTPVGVRAAIGATPAIQQTTGGFQPVQEITTVITSQAEFVAMCLDPANQQTGFWWQNPLGSPTRMLYAGPGEANPTLPPGQNMDVQPGQWIHWDGASWGGRAIDVGQAFGGTPVPGAFNPPAIPPSASYTAPAQPPATAPTAAVGAQAQIDPTQFQTVVLAIGAVGPPQAVKAGGWRWLNRRVWDKGQRNDPDQPTDQRPDDLQVTRERDHEELKAWNAVSGQWDVIYSRDRINAAIAALSLFEGTADHPGGTAIGAVHFDRLPDLTALTTAKDLSLVSHYWTYIGSPNFPVVAATPQIGTDLLGAVLNPGDWLQISNRGGDGTGAGANGGAPDLHWVTIGGDLLAKARADRLFGLLPWSAAGWEQGALVIYQGDVYRATRPVTAQDLSPKPVPVSTQVTLSGQVTNELTGGPFDTFLPNPADGHVETTTGSGSLIEVGGPFYNRNYATGDSFVYTSNPAFQGTGVTVQGYSYSKGWVSVGQTKPIPNPLVLALSAAPTPWQRVDISEGIKVAADMAGLPVTGPAGQVWIVLSDTHGKQALFSYDAAARRWIVLGGDVPLEHYSTEAILMAATPPDGTLGWGDDTNLVYARSGGAWHRVGGARVTVGTTKPTTPGQGDVMIDKAKGIAMGWDGTSWIGTSGFVMGQAGGSLSIPGYFAEDPSTTATVDETLGLAMRYSAAKFSLWALRSGWHVMIPELGDATNKNKAIIADANGYAAWSPGPVPVRIANVEQKNIEGQYLGDGYENFRRIEAEILWTPRSGDNTLMLVFTDSTGEIGASGKTNWTGALIGDYGDNGAREPTSGTGKSIAGSTGAQWISIIHAKQNKAVICRVSIVNAYNEWPVITVKTVGMHHNNHIVTYDHLIYPESVNPIKTMRTSGFTGEKNDVNATVYGYH